MEEKQGPQIFDTATFESVGTDENGEIKASDRPSGAGTYIASPSGGFVLQGSAKVPEPAKESEKSKKGKRKKSKTMTRIYSEKTAISPKFQKNTQRSKSYR